MSLFCRFLGHKGNWNKAKAVEGHWFSECTRCLVDVVKDTKGGRWLAHIRVELPFQDWHAQ